MTYGHVYVAQIASGANQMQTIKAFEEAEKFLTISDHCLYTMYHPWISRWHETIHQRSKRSSGFRLLVSIPLQPIND